MWIMCSSRSAMYLCVLKATHKQPFLIKLQVQTDGGEDNPEITKIYFYVSS